MKPQTNLRLPEDLRKKAEKYAKRYGYRNIQELATETIRQRIIEEESVRETLEIMKDKELIKSIERSRKDVAEGRVIEFSSIEELRKRLNEL